MVQKTDPVQLVREPRDLIEKVNHVFLDDAAALSPPQLSAVVQALKELVERLPQAFDQAAAVLDMLAARDLVVMDTGEDPKSFTAEAAAQLRAAATSSEHLAKELAGPGLGPVPHGRPGFVHVEQQRLSAALGGSC
ncbi:hypothetical protein ACFW6V_28365 [Streptomyces sp. NPDC058734]|uniref:hypothetical protein n=1 Tax=Streptomyces sp. NPDC058734 TaxID=3346615 RepID=UPI003676D0B8